MQHLAGGHSTGEANYRNCIIPWYSIFEQLIVNQPHQWFPIWNHYTNAVFVKENICKQKWYSVLKRINYYNAFHAT
jgi:hypothetical protein